VACRLSEEYLKADIGVVRSNQSKKLASREGIDRSSMFNEIWMLRATPDVCCVSRESSQDRS
jgi:hypothetical protein